MDNVDKKIKVHLQAGDNEDLYFKEQEQKQIQALREKVAKEEDRKYREEHKSHCFRCGTKSLAEVQYGEVTVDMCINAGCGAVHLDPGELEACQKIFKEQGALSRMRETIFSIFK